MKVKSRKGKKPQTKTLTLDDAITYITKEKGIKGADKLRENDLAGLGISRKRGSRAYIRKEDLDDAVEKDYFKFVPLPEVEKELGLFRYQMRELLQKQNCRVFWFNDGVQDYENGYILKGYVPLLEKNLQRIKNEPPRAKARGIY